MRMKKLLAAPLLAFVGLCGCQTSETATSGKNAAAPPANASAPAANRATPAPTPTPLPASNLKPGDIDVNKPVPAEELRNAFFADQEAWKGKQVAVVGTYNGHTTSKTQEGRVMQIRIDVQNEKYTTVLECMIDKEPGPEDFKQRQNRVFKGTVKGSSFRNVVLEPCEYVRQ